MHIGSPAVTSGDAFFDPWLVGRGERVGELVGLALAMIEHEESESGRRRRKRQGAHLETHRALVEAIVANLAHRVIAEGKRVAVSLAKASPRSRYDRPILRQLPETLRALERTGFLRLRLTGTRRARSTIEPTGWLRNEVAGRGIGFGDIGRHREEEVIILARTQWGFADASGGPAYGKHRHRVDYAADTLKTRRYRGEVRTINVFLAEADLGFDGSASRQSPVDHYHRRLRRYFTLPEGEEAAACRFDLGGRLFGGWWQNVANAERHRIRIDGEPVIDLDYASMFPRLAYLRAGLEPPEGDLYAIAGLEAHRSTVKRMLNAMLFATGRMTRLPSEVRRGLPRRWKLEEVREAILARHPALAPILETGIGLSLMFAESEVMMGVLLRLREEGIVALPMHDGVMAPISKAVPVRRAMEGVAREKTGYLLPVTTKRI